MRIFYLFIFALIFSFGCERLLIKTDIENTVQNNFKLFWEDVDQRYILFPYNHINWDSVYTSCYPAVNGTNLKETVVALGYLLKDGHFALYTPEKTFYAFQRFIIPDGYTDNSSFNNRYYFQLKELNNKVSYGSTENVGYIKISSFGDFSESDKFNQIDDLLGLFSEKKGMIIDIRSNPGGDINNAEILASRFIKERMLYAKDLYRNGKGHNDFTKPFLRYIEPDTKYNSEKPVVILTNRYTASASENFLLAMKDLPNIILVGDTTAGGLGFNELHELPNGWTYKITVALVLSRNDEVFEGKGIPPDFTVRISQPDYLNRKDPIIEKAISLMDK